MEPFDTTTTPTFCDRPHEFSIDTEIPGSRRIEAVAGDVGTLGDWTERPLRGTATRRLAAAEAGARLRVPFDGTAVSLLLPLDFVSPGPHYGTFGGRLRTRVDDDAWRDVPADRGREVCVASPLPSGPHVLEIECREAGNGSAGIEAVRAWDAPPVTVFGRIAGGPMLTDLRADVSGPVRFSRTVRDARTGVFSLLLPIPGEYRIDLSALGWEKHSLRVIASGPGEIVELPDITLTREAPERAPVRDLRADEPLVLVCFAHANIWGQESAEWLARRARWINDQRPHAVLDANEVNPVYVAGALSDLNCPLLMCSGNHSMPGFGDHLRPFGSDIATAPLRIIAAGRDVHGEPGWREALTRFTEMDKLRIVCAYEPFAPPELLALRTARFYFYGHSTKQGCYWQSGSTTFLRKVDANTFYRVEIGPPHDVSAPVVIQRFVFPRDE